MKTLLIKFGVLFEICTSSLFATSLTLPCPSILKMLSQISFLQGEETQHRDSDILGAYSELINALPEKFLIDMIEQDNPFYFPPAKNLEITELSSGFFILRDLVRKSPDENYLRKQLLKQLEARAANLTEHKNREVKVERRIKGITELIWNFPGRSLVSFFPSGKKALVDHPEAGMRTIIDFESGAEISYLNLPFHYASSAISAMDDWIVMQSPISSLADSATVLVRIDPANGSYSRLGEGETMWNPPINMAVSHDNRFIALAKYFLNSDEKMLQIWSTKDWKLIKALGVSDLEFAGNIWIGGTWLPVFSPDNNWIAGQLSTYVVLWNLATSESEVIPGHFEGEPQFSHDGHRLLLREGNKITVYAKMDSSFRHFVGSFDSTSFDVHIAKAFFGRDSSEIVIVGDDFLDRRMKILQFRIDASKVFRLEATHGIPVKRPGVIAHHRLEDGRVLLAIGFCKSIVVMDLDDPSDSMMIPLTENVWTMTFLGDGLELGVGTRYPVGRGNFLSKNGPLIYKLEL